MNDALIVRLPNHLGDACMSLPALQTLTDAGFRLHLVGKLFASALFEGHNWPVVVLRGGRMQQLRTLRAALAAVEGPARSAGSSSAAPSATAARKSSLAAAKVNGLLLTNSFSTALMFRLAGIAAAGYAADLRSPLLARAITPPALSGCHMVAWYVQLAAALVAATPAAHLAHVRHANAALPDRLGLRLSARAKTNAAALMHDAGLRPKRFVMLCPLAVGRHEGQIKAWSGFGALAEALKAQGLSLAVCPGPGERGAAMAAVPAACLLPETDVASFAAILANSALVVANDSGPGHLAAAVGAPLVSVFGATDASRTRPWGERLWRVGDYGRWPTLDEVLSVVQVALTESAGT